MRIAILTASDAGARGEREDASGQLLREWAEALGEVVETVVLPDDAATLERRLWTWVGDGLDVVLTTGSTGLGPRDVLPEVTRRVIDREIPGIAEAMRAESLRHTPFGMISRGLAGAARETLILNFPGSPKAVEELWPVVEPVISHLVRLLHGETRHENS
ncbi:MogA/MoaB family molybdenum cofactor biosynthesis protein [Sulfobacillus sp. DSM 109850]|uniref:MogA/MoaB family molybdenum cofactor biosynthesis protein n=1 Tax=Sulfobacillus harzensis TaxID=2729629 RepID=A0A7Y0L6N1_9FIRM|nr:MogA/MoaB family molybdenum cofactor biosynthesis protein [Sulfobacillus harzensis]